MTVVRAMSATAKQLWLLAATVACLAPLAFMLVTSLRSPEDYAVNPSGFPAAWTLQNYIRALGGRLVMRAAFDAFDKEIELVGTE